MTLSYTIFFLRKEIILRGHVFFFLILVLGNSFLGLFFAGDDFLGERSFERNCF